jgi:hypothetical protein
MRVLDFKPTAKYFFWLLLCLLVSWCAYLWFGQKLIQLAFDASDSFWADTLMAERASTPLEDYYRQADAFMVHATLLAILTFSALAFLMNKPREALLFIVSLLFSTFLLFCLFEKFPSLIPLVRLDRALGYYAYKVNYIPDPELVFREKPFNRRVIHNFSGTGFSPQYRIEVQPYTIEWIMDRDGFRNQTAADSADILVLGDSYVEYGSNEADTFVGRLQQKLIGLRVRNLGKSGYTIAQYVHTLRRFGLPYKPRLVIMAIYEGNDIRGMRDYLLWKSGRTNELAGQLVKFNTDSLLRRYGAAATATAVELKKRIDTWEDGILDRLALMRGRALPAHPAVAMVDLNGRMYPKVFIDKLPATTPAQMLASEEFQAIRNLLIQFKEICRSHGIVPLVLYIPTASQIYAEYSSPASGSQWLDIRERQIAARQNTESAVRTAVEEAGLGFVSLSPLFKDAAAEGKMLYYPLDAHWNAEGRELAAQFIAGILQTKLTTKG